ncbi:MAG TPA: pyridoxamine 5'-phosphate oxidase family protein [Xanthomonadales bacterium]|nr:pyridoxamine 5'-phosphate oxidase family protein [Xanthomonadales bacterium]
MQNSNIQRAKKIIEQILYITIATVSKDGTPHNSPVFSAFDKNYNFYWGSHRHAQHSINIRANENIFLVIYDSTVEAGTGKGVYVKAKAKELENPEDIALAHNLLQSRRPVPFWKIEQVQGDTPIRLYKAIPEKFWVNEDGDKDGNYIDIREEIDLSK